MIILMKIFSFLLVGIIIFLYFPITLFCLIDFIDDLVIRCIKGLVDGLSNLWE